MDFYRFSISWARILPAGYRSPVNQKGIDFYNNVIDALLERDIVPMITIYHWDLPQALQDIGGWANPLIVDYFTEYARVLFDNFADRVPYWITMNEPNPICREGYGLGEKAPAVESSGLAEYQCVHHLLKAHASAYHLFNNKYRSKLDGKSDSLWLLSFYCLSSSSLGKVGFAMDMDFTYPYSESSEDIRARENALQFMVASLTSFPFKKYLL